MPSTEGLAPVRDLTSTILYTAAMIQAHPPIPYFHTFSPKQQCPPHTSHDHPPLLQPWPLDPTCHITWHPALHRAISLDSRLLTRQDLLHAYSISINQGKGILWHSYYYWPHRRTEPKHTTLSCALALNPSLRLCLRDTWSLTVSVSVSASQDRVQTTHACGHVTFSFTTRWPRLRMLSGGRRTHSDRKRRLLPPAVGRCSEWRRLLFHHHFVYHLHRREHLQGQVSAVHWWGMVWIRLALLFWVKTIRFSSNIFWLYDFAWASAKLFCYSSNRRCCVANGAHSGGTDDSCSSQSPRKPQK